MAHRRSYYRYHGHGPGIESLQLLDTRHHGSWEGNGRALALQRLLAHGDFVLRRALPLAVRLGSPPACCLASPRLRSFDFRRKWRARARDVSQAALQRLALAAGLRWRVAGGGPAGSLRGGTLRVHGTPRCLAHGLPQFFCAACAAACALAGASASTSAPRAAPSCGLLRHALFGGERGRHAGEDSARARSARAHGEALMAATASRFLALDEPGGPRPAWCWRENQLRAGPRPRRSPAEEPAEEGGLAAEAESARLKRRRHCVL